MDESVAVSDKTNFVLPKNDANHNNNNVDNRVLFPKKLAVDVKFENITFTANEWNFNLKQFPKGKWLFKKYNTIESPNHFESITLKIHYFLIY